MNRYIERAENHARFIGVTFNLILDMPPNEQAQWEPLLYASGDYDTFKEYYDENSRANVLRFMSFDERNPNAILSTLHRARENARSIREIISKEMWEHINQFYHSCKEAAGKTRWRMEDWQDFFNQIKIGSQLYYGIVDSTFTRREGWEFSRLGRYLERADKTSRFLDVKYFILLPDLQAVGGNLDMLQWSAVLKSVSAFNMYRQTHLEINPQQIVEFLVLDNYFPRSLYYCTKEVEAAILNITDNAGKRHPAVKAIGKLRSDLDFTDTKDIFDYGLHQYLDRFQKKLNDIGDVIYESFFALKPEIETESSTMEQ
jgi:uncharacterized alpha-E superfamily protein